MPLDYKKNSAMAEPPLASSSLPQKQEQALNFEAMSYDDAMAALRPEENAHFPREKGPGQKGASEGLSLGIKDPLSFPRKLLTEVADSYFYSIKTRLMELGYLSRSALEREDGEKVTALDDNTKSAISQFQEDNGLKGTGTLDSHTMGLLGMGTRGLQRPSEDKDEAQDQTLDFSQLPDTGFWKQFKDLSTIKPPNEDYSGLSVNKFWKKFKDLSGDVLRAALTSSATQYMLSHIDQLSPKIQKLPDAKSKIIGDVLMDRSSSIQDMKAIIQARFNIRIEGKDAGESLVSYLKYYGYYHGPTEFGPRALRKIYDILAKYPKDKLSSVNTIIAEATNQYSDAASGVAFTGGGPMAGTLAVSYNEANIEAIDSRGAYADEGDALANTNFFEGTTAHEIAHLVDQHKSERDEDFLAIHHWVEVAPKDVINVVKENLEDKGDIPGLSKDEQSLYDFLAEQIVTDSSLTEIGGLKEAFFEELKNREFAESLDPEALFVTLTSKSTLLPALLRSLDDNHPWMTEPYSYFTDKQVHASYPNEWWSYKTSTRTEGDKLSKYAFRDPGETFGELMAAYFSTTPPGQAVPERYRAWLGTQGYPIPKAAPKKMSGSGD